MGFLTDVAANEVRPLPTPFQSLIGIGGFFNLSQMNSNPFFLFDVSIPNRDWWVF